MAGKLVLAAAMSHGQLPPWDSSTSILPGITIASNQAAVTTKIHDQLKRDYLYKGNFHGPTVKFQVICSF